MGPLKLGCHTLDSSTRVGAGNLLAGWVWILLRSVSWLRRRLATGIVLSIVGMTTSPLRSHIVLPLVNSRVRLLQGVRSSPNLFIQRLVVPLLGAKLVFRGTSWKRVRRSWRSGCSAVVGNPSIDCVRSLVMRIGLGRGSLSRWESLMARRRISRCWVLPCVRLRILPCSRVLIHFSAPSSSLVRY